MARDFQDAFAEIVGLVNVLPVEGDADTAKARACREIGKILLSLQFGGDPCFPVPQIKTADFFRDGASPTLAGTPRWTRQAFHDQSTIGSQHWSSR